MCQICSAYPDGKIEPEGIIHGARDSNGSNRRVDTVPRTDITGKFDQQGHDQLILTQISHWIEGDIRWLPRGHISQKDEQRTLPDVLSLEQIYQYVESLCLIGEGTRCQ